MKTICSSRLFLPGLLPVKRVCDLPMPICRATTQPDETQATVGPCSPNSRQYSNHSRYRCHGSVAALEVDRPKLMDLVAILSAKIEQLESIESGRPPGTKRTALLELPQRVIYGRSSMTLTSVRHLELVQVPVTPVLCIHILYAQTVSEVWTAELSDTRVDWPN
jgi:hypothetical protein